MGAPRIKVYLVSSDLNVLFVCNYWSEKNAMYNNWDEYSFAYALTLAEQLWGVNGVAKKRARPKS